MSFAKELKKISNESSQVIKEEQREREKIALEKKQAFLEKQRARYNELITKLTSKHAKNLRDNFIKAAKGGKSHMLMYFDREEFKANFPGLGNPYEFALKWLNEMSNPNSTFLITDDLGKKICFEGIRHSIRCNGSFTVLFNWS
jgi:hypothetical protein